MERGEAKGWKWKQHTLATKPHHSNILQSHILSVYWVQQLCIGKHCVETTVGSIIKIFGMLFFIFARAVGNLIPKPSSIEERRIWRIQYILTLWASCCYGITAKTANLIVLPKFWGGGGGGGGVGLGTRLSSRLLFVACQLHCSRSDTSFISRPWGTMYQRFGAPYKIACMVMNFIKYNL